MPNLNRVMLMGNLTRDVETRSTPSGSTIAAFGMAINRKWTDNQGETREEVTFVDCEAWGKTAEVVARYVSKGSPLYVEGRLKLDQWEDKDGGKRSKLKVVVEMVQLLGGKPEGRTEERQQPAKAPVRGPAKPAPRATAAIHDDDIPF